MAKTPTTLTIPQVESLMGLSAQLKTTFAGIDPTEVVGIISLFLSGHAPYTPAGSKSDQLIEMLARPQGATIDEVVDAFGIKKNSAYARISVETRKRKLKVKHADGRYHVQA